MSDFIKFSVENIRNIPKMGIVLHDDLQIIKSQSNTGKTTFAKLFTIFFNSVANSENIAKEIIRKCTVKYICELVYDAGNVRNNITKDIKEWVYSEYFFQKYLNNMNLFEKDLKCYLQESDIYISNEDIIELISNISSEFKRLNKIAIREIIKNKCSGTFYDELNGFNNTEGEISLYINGRNLSCKVQDNNFSEFLDEKLKTSKKVLYFGDFSMFNSNDIIKPNDDSICPWFTATNFFENNFSDEQDKFFWKEKVKEIIEKINTVCTGNLEKINNAMYYSFVDENSIIRKTRVENLSEQDKVFLFIKTSIEKGIINQNTILIVDGMNKYLEDNTMWDSKKDILAEILALIQYLFKINVIVMTNNTCFQNTLKIYRSKLRKRHI